MIKLLFLVISCASHIALECLFLLYSFDSPFVTVFVWSSNLKLSARYLFIDCVLACLLPLDVYYMTYQLRIVSEDLVWQTCVEALGCATLLGSPIILESLIDLIRVLLP